MNAVMQSPMVDRVEEGLALLWFQMEEAGRAGFQEEIEAVTFQFPPEDERVGAAARRAGARFVRAGARRVRGGVPAVGRGASSSGAPTAGARDSPSSRNPYALGIERAEGR